MLLDTLILGQSSAFQVATPLSATAWAVLAGVPVGIIALYFLKLRRRPVEVPSTLLWRRSLRAYVRAFQWQSLVLSLVFVLVGYFGHDAELYIVAAFLFVLKVAVIPWYLNRLYERVGGERESQPYVNVATSLIAAGLLVLLAYVITQPLVRVSALPTRGGLPLAMGLILVGLFVIITRRKALTQVVGFLVLENGIALLADIFATLRATGFDGYLSIELFNPTYWQQDPHEVARTALAKLKAAAG